MRRSLLLFIVYSFLCCTSFGQVSSTSQWTWVKGDSALPQFAVYGTQGIATSSNKPGGREYASTWKDASGNFWLFGGQGNDAVFSGSLNDLWKYNSSTNQWTWIKGDSVINGVSVYGVKATAAQNNKPGARSQSVSWTDAAGNLWLYGGYGNATNGVTDLNDLWKYDPLTNQWTWMNGDSTAGVGPVFGTQGTPAPANKPGGRLAGNSWTDAAGKLWLFGGYGISSFGYGRLNDLWKYDPDINQWTWVKGNPGANTSGSYGTQGVADPSNLPPSRNSAVSWLDAAGKFWIFGGVNNNGNSVFNDLWQYDPSTNNWTWMKGDNSLNVYGIYGSKGTAASPNKPGGRSMSVSWTDAAGKLWLFGGSAYAATTVGQANDLWKYDPTTNQWSWVNGDSIVNVNGIYGNQSSYSNNNKPGSRVSAVSWRDQSGKFWMMGGNGFAALSNGNMNDLWQYDPSINQWAWMKGDTSVVLPMQYGTQGVASSFNKPSQRNLNTSWTDNLGNLWMFGGLGIDTKGNNGFLNDLWKYNPSLNQWTWMKGDSVSSAPAVYGTKGIAAAGNKPGARGYAISWADNAGNLWLFGGFGSTASSTGNLNDLWKYNTSSNLWTWMSGDSTAEQAGVYGNLGAATSTNKPGGRQSSVSFTDASGNLWLFGGRGKAASAAGFGGYLNDLWKYDVSSNQWTWMKGDSLLNKAGTYGTLGTAANNNKPGGRQNPVAWTDNSGNLFMFGGSGYGSSAAGYGGYLNDLWKYDLTLNQWTWMNGDSAINITGNYGTVDVGAATNKPGGRYGSSAMKDNTGNLILFGGFGEAASDYGNGGGSLNDLWKYDPSKNQWAWEKGDSIINVRGIYGTPLTASTYTKPGSRNVQIAWKDNGGNFWLYGGYGYAAVGTGYLNDLWKLNVSAALPVTWLNFTGVLNNNTTLLTWSVTNQLNNKGFDIEKSAEGKTFSAIGFVNSADNLANINNYSFIDEHPADGANYYRLKQWDKDGRFTYSKVVEVNLNKNYVAVSPNPATQFVNIQCASAILRLQCFNSAGILLFAASPNTNHYQLKLTQFSSGSYFIHMLTANGMVEETFIKL